MFTSPGPHERFQLPQYLLEEATAEHRQSRRLLECINDHLLTQIIKVLLKEGITLDFTLRNNKELLRTRRLGAALATVTM